MCRYLNKVKLYIENYIGIDIYIDKIEYIREDYMICIPEMNKILYDDFMYYLNINPTRYQMWPIYIYKYEHIYVGINNVKIIICDIINNKIVEKRCDGHIFKTYIYIIPNKKGTIEIIYEYTENGELYCKIINIKHKKIEYNYDYKNNRIMDYSISVLYFSKKIKMIFLIPTKQEQSNIDRALLPTIWQQNVLILSQDFILN